MNEDNIRIEIKTRTWQIGSRPRPNQNMTRTKIKTPPDCEKDQATSQLAHNATKWNEVSGKVVGRRIRKKIHFKYSMHKT